MNSEKLTVRFEALDENRRWSRDAAGDVGSVAYEFSPEELEKELSNLARLLECPRSEVRAVQV